MFITICFNNGIIFLLHCRNKLESVNFVLLWFVIGPANSRKTNHPSVVRVFPRSISFPYFYIESSVTNCDLFFCSGWFVVIQLYFLLKITCVIKDGIERQEVVLPINYNYNKIRERN